MININQTLKYSVVWVTKLISGKDCEIVLKSQFTVFLGKDLNRICSE